MRRGAGWVYQPPKSRFWHMQYFVDGKRVRESTGKETEVAARDILEQKLAAIRQGDAVPREERLTVGDLFKLVDDNYKLRRNRSIDTMRCSFRHVLDFFGPKAKVARLGHRLEDYVEHRREEGASEATIRIELALLDRGFSLAVQKKLLSPRARPHVEKPAPDLNRVRKGFFRRAEVERLCQHLPDMVTDVVFFLFFCPWRIGAARRLEWRDYSESERALTLRPDLNKTGHELKIPVDPENAPELMAVIDRQQPRRRPDCPFLFHGRDCGKPARFDQLGKRRPCLGDFRKVWDRACGAIGMVGRTPHDLRRSGVKHYIDAGVDPHTVMQWSGHRTESMLRRYHIIDLDDLRRAGKRASDYRGPKENIIRPDFGRIATEQPHQTRQTGSDAVRS